MMEQNETGYDLQLTGKSGSTYEGRIYSDKQGNTTLPAPAIVCLSNSQLSDGQWQHQMRDIYDTADTQKAIEHFRIRDDISHLILIPKNSAYNGMDSIDDLRRQYLHG